MTTTGTTVPLDLLRDALSDSAALPPLSREHYARTHAAFEAASDQRTRLQTWMTDVLAPLLPGSEPVRVVGVGVGDGSLDAPLAAALARDGRRVHYTGVEPDPGTAGSFLARLAALDAETLTPTVVVGDFAEHDPGRPVDLVHFVHSLYYVPDLSATLDQALALLRPGGLLVTAIAPLDPLCVLTELLCPWAERTPWFAADVREQLADRGLATRCETLVAHLDVRDVLADPLGLGAAVLDFLVGADTATMPAVVLGHVHDHLRALGIAGSVPHPIDLTIVRVPDGRLPASR